MWLLNKLNCIHFCYTIQNVFPDPRTSCGPYEPEILSNNLWRMNTKSLTPFSSKNHDTIGIIAIDNSGNVAAATSSNGASHKIPGYVPTKSVQIRIYILLSCRRVGDSPLPGAGAYADNDVGAAVATGDGDIMMRFLPR